MLHMKLDGKHEEIIEKYRHGLSIRDISKEYSVNKNSIGNIISQTVGVRKRGLSEEQKNTALKLYNAGLNINQVSKQMDLNHATLSRFLKKMGAVSKETKKKKYEHLMDTFIAQYKAGKTLQDIAKEHGVSNQTVANYLLEADINLRSYSESSRKSVTCDTFFLSRNSHNMHIAGKFFAYGRIQQVLNGFRIDLQKSSIFSDRLLMVARHVTDKKELSLSEDDIACLSIYSKQLYKDLDNLGIRKETQLNIPNLYKHDFILGYIEENIRFGSTNLYILTGNDGRMAKEIRAWLEEEGVKSFSFDEKNNKIIIGNQTYGLLLLSKYPQLKQLLPYASSNNKKWWNNKLEQQKDDTRS